MARLHHLLSRALASDQLLQPPPASAPLRSTRQRGRLSRSTRCRRHLLFMIAAYSPSSPPPRGTTRRRRPDAGGARRPHRCCFADEGEEADARGPERAQRADWHRRSPPPRPPHPEYCRKLQTDVGKAMKVSFDNLEGLEYKTRDTCISNVSKYDTIEVSLLLCDDNFISKLNKEWRDEDHGTDVLSMSQHIPGVDIPILQLGDIVISVETARKGKRPYAS